MTSHFTGRTRCGHCCHVLFLSIWLLTDALATAHVNGELGEKWWWPPLGCWRYDGTACYSSKPIQYNERMRPGQAQMICASFSPGGMFLAAGSADHHVRWVWTDTHEQAYGLVSLYSVLYCMQFWGIIFAMNADFPCVGSLQHCTTHESMWTDEDWRTEQKGARNWISCRENTPALILGD